LRILLLSPPGSEKNLINSHAEGFDVRRFLPVGPPHALCSLAGNLKEHDVEIVDYKAEYALGLDAPLEEVLLDKVAEFKPALVGITVVTSEYNVAMQMLEAIKKHDQRILTVVGGVHVSLCPGDFERSFIDIAVFGPGKSIFRSIVDCFGKKEDFSNIPNICINKNGSFVYTKRKNLFQCPGELLSDVSADRSLISQYIDAYHVGSEPNRNAMGFIETSYGCPNKCSFCSIWPAHQGHYHERDAESIVNELKMLHEYKVVRFIDANTMGNIDHITTVMDRIMQENFNYYYMMDIRSDTAAEHEDIIKQAAEMGVVIAIVGLETVNDNELHYYKKQATLSNNLKAIEIFHKYNINMRASFLIQPTYLEKNFLELKKFVTENELKHSVFSIMTPFPGTSLYREYQDKIVIKDLSYYNLLNSVLPTSLPEDEFYKMMTFLYEGQVRVC
jgi:hopanoid C-3 methylase